MLDQVIDYLNKVDSFAAIEYLNRQDDPLAVIETYAKLVVQLYWEEKKLPAVVAMARAGVQYGLSAAAAMPDPDTATKIKSKAREIAYNLASFTWPGWAEPGIEIGWTDLAIGLDAAKTVLRLVKELNLGDLRLSRAYWMLGGHHLAAGNLSEAEACFNQAENFATSANSETDRLIDRGFSLLAAILASPDKIEVQNQLEQVKRQLAQQEHGDDFIKQIDAAWSVFTK
jgi:hypothetical protein